MDELSAKLDGVFKGGIELGEDASADAVARLDDFNAESSAREIKSRGKAGYASTEDENVGRQGVV